jgi:hypothetical protein
MILVTRLIVENRVGVCQVRDRHQNNKKEHCKDKHLIDHALLVYQVHKIARNERPLDGCDHEPDEDRQKDGIEIHIRRTNGDQR